MKHSFVTIAALLLCGCSNHMTPEEVKSSIAICRSHGMSYTLDHSINDGVRIGTLRVLCVDSNGAYYNASELKQ